jgi:hypothetical protein
MPYVWSIYCRKYGKCIVVCTALLTTPKYSFLVVLSCLVVHTAVTQFCRTYSIKWENHQVKLHLYVRHHTPPHKWKAINKQEHASQMVGVSTNAFLHYARRRRKNGCDWCVVKVVTSLWLTELVMHVCIDINILWHRSSLRYLIYI